MFVYRCMYIQYLIIYGTHKYNVYIWNGKHLSKYKYNVEQFCANTLTGGKVPTFIQLI